MDYRNKRTKGIAIMLILCLTSCGMGEKKHRDVDPFYTQKRFGQQFALLPLAKPMKLYYDTDNGDWGLPITHNRSGVTVINPIEIGVQGEYVYGKVEPNKTIIDSLDVNEIVYAWHKGGASWSKTLKEDKGYKRVDAIDGKPDTYILPERWYVINASESTGTGFFDEEDYLKDLKDKGIEGKMYKSDSLLKEFRKTGILEYFPDSIKTKLRR